MRKSTVALCLAASTLVPGLAMAQASQSPHTFTGNVGLFSQYIFRGLTQTNGEPALQGGADYSHSSGFYLGGWGSNVSWYEETNVGSLAAPIKLSQPGAAGGNFRATGSNSNSLELDFYGGWKNTWGDWGLDVGLLQYYYPGTYNNLGGYFSKPNTLEIYGAVSWKWITLKYSNSLSDAFGVKSSKGSDYLDLSAGVPLGASGFTLGLHVGKQRFDGTSPVWDFGFGAGSGVKNNIMDYTDYKLSIAKEWAGLNWTAAYTTTNTKATTTALGVTGAVWQNVYGKDIGKSTLTLSVQKTF
jgi:uncharacterized protein (TIGR02001 family)